MRHRTEPRTSRRHEESRETPRMESRSHSAEFLHKAARMAEGGREVGKTRSKKHGHKRTLSTRITYPKLHLRSSGRGERRG